MKKFIFFIVISFILTINTYASVIGDVNGDGKVNTMDYILIRKHILKNPSLTGNELKKADVNSDGKVNSADYIIVRKTILGQSIDDKPNVISIHFIAGDISYSANGNKDGNTHFSDAILLESNGKYAMIDMSTKYNYNKYVKKYLKELGVKELEFVIITHLHTDHVGGLTTYLNEKSHDFTIKKVYFKRDCKIKPATYSKVYNHNCIDESYSNRIDTLAKKLKSAKIQVVNPEKDNKAYYSFKFEKMSIMLTNLQEVTQIHEWDNDNINSMIALITITTNNKKYRVLSYGDSYLSDINLKAANKLTNNGKEKIDLLKMEHHAWADISDDNAKAAGATHMVITATCSAVLSDSAPSNAIEKYSKYNPKSYFYFANNASSKTMKDKFSTYDYWRAGISFEFSDSIKIRDVHFDNGVVLTSPKKLAASKASKIDYYSDGNRTINALCK